MHKMEEFNLSDKILEDEEFGDIPIKDVKEFIRILKEELIEMHKISYPSAEINLIDNLAGDKLIK